MKQQNFVTMVVIALSATTLTACAGANQAYLERQAMGSLYGAANFKQLMAPLHPRQQLAMQQQRTVTPKAVTEQFAYAKPNDKVQTEMLPDLTADKAPGKVAVQQAQAKPPAIDPEAERQLQQALAEEQQAINKVKSPQTITLAMTNAKGERVWAKALAKQLSITPIANNGNGTVAVVRNWQLSNKVSCGGDTVFNLEGSATMLQGNKQVNINLTWQACVTDIAPLTFERPAKNNSCNALNMAVSVYMVDGEFAYESVFPANSIVRAYSCNSKTPLID